MPPEVEELDPRLLFVDVGLTLPQIVERCAGQPGCSLSTLKRRCRDEGWVAQRELHRLKIDTKVGAARNKTVTPADAVVDTGADIVTPVVTLARPLSGLYEEAIDRALDRLAQDRAEDIIAAYEQLDAVWKMQVRGLFIANMDVTAWLTAHRAKLEGTGRKVVDEETGAESDELTVTDKRISIGQRADAIAALATTTAIRERLAATDPIAGARKARASVRQAEATARYYEMRTDGTLPPDKVQHEFARLTAEEMEQHRQRMTPDAFEQLVDSIERSARQGAAGVGGEVPRGAGGSPN